MHTTSVTNQKINNFVMVHLSDIAENQARGYKTFFMLNWTERDISTAHKH